MGLTYTEPLLPIFLLLGLVSLVRLWLRKPSPKPVLLTIAFAGLFLVSWPPVDWLLSRPLEGPYWRLRLPRPLVADAIVVPASNVEPARGHFPIALPDTSTYARCRYAAWLHREVPQVPIVVSGGNRSPKQPPFAHTMAEVLAAEDVPSEQILLEVKSVNTWENALYTAELLRAKGLRRIILVVDADSMLRAELCFRKQGLEVIAAPIRHRSVSFTLSGLTPSWRALRRNEVMLHEVIGLVWYKLLGRI
jgi:uncharacterized SAM-binding protein YcdF (DUF218 family)